MNIEPANNGDSYLHGEFSEDANARDRPVFRNGQVSKLLTADQYIRQIKSVAIWGFFRLHVYICRLFSNGDLPIKLPRVLYIELSIANSPKLNFSILL